MTACWLVSGVAVAGFNGRTLPAKGLSRCQLYVPPAMYAVGDSVLDR